MSKVLSKSFLNSIPTVKDTVNKEVFDLIGQNIRLTLPAVVTDVGEYGDTQCVDVQPLIGATFEDNETYKSPKIKKVFVKLANAGKFKQTYPIKVGDIMTLHWSHRDMNTYLNSSSKSEFVYPDEDDKWGNNDVYATIGFGVRGDNQSPDPDNYIFSTEDNKYRLTITPTGNTTEDSVDKIENNTNSTVNTETRTENSTTHNINAGTSLNITTPVTNIDGMVNITGVTTAPIYQGVLQGPNGGNAVSDKEFSAVKLHAGDGASGTALSDDGKTLVFVDGICVSIT